MLLAAALWLQIGWRGVMAGLAVASLPLVAAVRRVTQGPSAMDTSPAWHHALAALRRRDVLRRLALLEAADLLVDVFHAYLALYFVDVVHVDTRAAALGVAVWTGAGLAGDWLLLWVLRVMRGARYLRLSAAGSGNRPCYKRHPISLFEHRFSPGNHDHGEVLRPNALASIRFR